MMKVFVDVLEKSPRYSELCEKKITKLLTIN